MKSLSLIAATILLFALTATARAADPVRIEINSVDEQPGVLSATVAVYGANGLPVASLPQSSLKATLDGTPLTVTGVKTATTTVRPPISVVLIADVSGSMYGDPIARARQALKDFVVSLDPSDQVAVFSFSTNVKLLQDFTRDKNLAAQAVSTLTPFGDTALYDAVIEGARKATQAGAERKLVILLTDGVATVNVGRRAASLDEARQSGASFVAIGLGPDLDRGYLSDLASTTNGKFLEAPTPDALQQTYASLSAAIRTTFQVTMKVPDSMDRTVQAKLAITATLGGGSSTAEQVIPPLPGAVPPPLTFDMTGLASGMRINTPVTLDVSVAAGAAGVTVEYGVDGQAVFNSSGPVYAYQLDPASLANGPHLVSARVTDQRGRVAEKQVSFEVVPASKSGGGSTLIFALPVVLVAIGGVAFYLLKRRQEGSDGYSKRIKPWRGKVPDVAGPMMKPPGEWTPLSPRPSTPPAERVLGRVIVMDEAAIRNGGLDGIREYELGSNPLIVGSDETCDIVINDGEGRIGGEEARIWVQRGRLVYHKLTTLSAMATEGVTSGWQFLDSGEDIAIGPCRLVFELRAVAEEDLPAEDLPPRPEIWPADPEDRAPSPTARRQEIWPMRPEETGRLGASSD